YPSCVAPFAPNRPAFGDFTNSDLTFAAYFRDASTNQTLALFAPNRQNTPKPKQSSPPPSCQSPTTGIPVATQYANVISPSGAPSNSPTDTSHTDSASAQITT